MCQIGRFDQRWPSAIKLGLQTGRISSPISRSQRSPFQLP